MSEIDKYIELTKGENYDQIKALKMAIDITNLHGDDPTQLKKVYTYLVRKKKLERILK